MTSTDLVEALLVGGTCGTTFLLGLVMWAFRRRALSTEDSVLAAFVAGIFWLAAAIATRGLFWDALPWVLDPDTLVGAYPVVNWPNILFDFVVMMAALRLLRGFLLMIPEDERSCYNILTAALYPRRLYFKLTAHHKEPKP